MCPALSNGKKATWIKFEYTMKLSVGELAAEGPDAL
jgi:hypothetical protein